MKEEYKYGKLILSLDKILSQIILFKNYDDEIYQAVLDLKTKVESFMRHYM